MIKRFFNIPAVPPEYRSNFTHLILDIGWFGILSGSAVNFLNVYAARLGATGFQIGLMGAMSALVNLVFAIPTGHWLQQRSVSKAVFWTSVIYRLGFLLWVPLPWLFSSQEQIWALILLALLMGIPLTALSVGFNALFAEAVPDEWRAYLVGLRNIVLSVTFMASSLGSGYLLDHMPFPGGYQVVFAIGFFGAAMSSLHIWFIRPVEKVALPPQRPPARSSAASLLRMDIWKTPFSKVLLILLGFHLAQFLAIPLFPIYFVRELNLTDQQIGLGTAVFYGTVLLGSTQLARLTRRFQHRGVSGLGIMLMSLYPILLSFSHTLGLFLLTSAIGGVSWSLVGGALTNYLLEKVPENDRPVHLAWYNLILNAAVLAGSLSGPFIAGYIGLMGALILFGTLRLLAGLVMLRWG